VNDQGLYIKLHQNGAQGFIDKSEIGEGFYSYDKAKSAYINKKNKENFHIGKELLVTIVKADPTTCSILFAIYREKQSKK